MADLRVSINGIEFRNPVLTASGTFGYGEEYSDFLDSVKTAMFFEDWINEKTEEEILEKFSVRPGEIKTKIDNAEWLLYAAEELARIVERQDLIKELAKLRIRII